MAKSVGRSPLLGIGLTVLALCTVPLTVHAAGVIDAGTLLRDEPGRIGTVEQRGDAVQLPNGMNSEDVVRMVQDNRAALRRSVSGSGSPGAAEDVGQPFSIRGSIPAQGKQYHSAMAFDGTNYLVVWADGRDGVPRIYGARVRPDGLVLDPNGVAISTSADEQLYPAVAFDGTNYLVVWMDSSDVGCDIFGARVSPAGSVLDGAGIAISTAANGQYYPAVTFEGTNYLVVWTDRRDGSSWDIYGARVSVAGSVLDGSGIAISTADYDQGFPAVACDGTNSLVVWNDSRGGSNYDIYGARVSPGGSVLDAGGRIVCDWPQDQREPSVAFDGTDYFVVWSCASSGVGVAIRGARVNVEGSVTRIVTVYSALGDRGYPAVCFDGTNYLVSWCDWSSGSGDIYGARVSAGTSDVLDPEGIAVSLVPNTNQQLPAVGSSGAGWFVAWDNWRGGSSDIYGARLDAGGSVLDQFGMVVSRGETGDKIDQAVAFDGTNYLVVWREQIPPVEDDIYGARVNAGGTVLDPAGIAISTAWDLQYWPDVAFDGTNYLVVWADRRSGSPDIYGARVSTGGVVLDTAGIAISMSTGSQMRPVVAFDGTNSLVVWYDNRNDNVNDIYGARVTQQGVVLDFFGGIPISTAAGDQWFPAVAFDGTNYLVVWHDYRNGSQPDIYAARVSTGGSVLDGSGIAVSTAAGDQVSAAVASDGTNFLVVWEDRRSGTFDDIYGARVSAGGSVLDPSGLTISDAAGNQETPAIAFDGTDFLVVWTDWRSGGGYPGIYGARVTSAGEVLDPAGIGIATDPLANSAGPCAVMGPVGQVLVCYISKAWLGYWYPFFEISGSLFGGYVGVEPEQAPMAFSLCQSFPNPFNPSCTIRYVLPLAGRATLRIFDVSGSPVRTLVDAWQERGTHSEVWDGVADNGTALPSGVYFYSIEAGEFAATHKMVLLK